MTADSASSSFVNYEKCVLLEKILRIIVEKKTNPVLES